MKTGLSSTKIAVLYAAAGSLWIIFSDKILAALLTDPQSLTRFQTYKGWAFIAATAFLVYGLISRYTARIQKSHEDLLTSRQYNRTLFESSPIGLALCSMDGSLIDVNEAFANIMGRTVEETLRLTYWDITPEKYADQEVQQLESLRKTGSYGPYEKEYKHRDGRLVPVRLRGIIIERSGERFIWSSAEDISERKLAERIQTSELQLLEMISSGAALPEVLEKIVLSIESLLHETAASILLLDPDGIHVHYGAAPHLPEAYNRALEGQAIGPRAGSCGTAMYRREPVIVADIGTDPLWTDYRELALTYGLRACWSTPIMSPEGNVLGSFALYYHEPRSPREEDLRLIERTTHIAGIAIERKKAEEALHRSEEWFRSLFENMLEGFAHCKMIFDDNAHPTDFVYLNVNRSFEKLTGLKNVVGRKETEIFPEVRELHPEMFEIFGRVALTGRPEKYEIEFKPLQQVFILSIYSIEKGYCVLTFDNITKRKRMEEELRRLNEELEKRVRERTMELEEKIAEIGRMNKLFVGRELRMIELKERLRALEPKN